MLTLKQREQKRTQKKHKQRQFNWPGNLTVIAGVLSVLSAFYLLIAFRNIVLDDKWFLLSIVVFCLPILLFCSKRNYYTMYYWFLAAGAFFFVNSVFAEGKTFTVKRLIEYKYYRHTRSGPHAEINYKRVGLSVNCDDDKTLSDSHFAVLTLSKGFFNIEIVRDSKLTRE
ncbi:hypothetical protein [Mucilaginibacter sp.]|uniref:hypothetical protein n=1 Tax=Mucilaginibacter sp. TaxID=1882438 RepID=UPI00326710B9